MQHNPADLDIDFELFFTRAELVAAEWDLDFAESEESESERALMGIKYIVKSGAVRAELIYQVEDARGYVEEEAHAHEVHAEEMIADLASLDATAAARIQRQAAALALLDERDCGYGRMGSTLAEMAGHIRSLRDLGEGGQLAAVMIADQIHDDERAAALAMAGVR